MKVALIADTHADEHSRFDEHETVMRWTVDTCIEEDVDLVLHAGDVFERSSTTVEERAAVGRWVRRIAERCPIIIVAGNHDDPRDIAWLGRLRTDHTVHAMDVAGVLDMSWCTVACLPWPRRSSILAAVGEVSRDAANSVAQEALRNVLRGMSRDGAVRPHLFVGHVDLNGAVTDKDQPLVNGDMSLSLSDLALVRASFYGLGHVHAAQSFEIDGAPCVYPGAPRHCNFGEPTPGKGIVIAELDDRGKVSVRRRAAPCRPMLLLEDAWTSDGWSVYDWGKLQDGFDGAEVRFRYDVARDRRDAAMAAAELTREVLMQSGAYSVKVEERVREVSRARAPEIATATTTADQFKQWLTSTSQELTEERETRVLDKLEQIERAA